MVNTQPNLLQSKEMNHLIFTAVLTACLGIGGYQQGSEFFGPSPEGLGHDPHFDPGQLNSSHTGHWSPLVSPHSMLSIAVYTTLYYALTYFAGNFGRYNVHAKVFCWLMTIYPIITALTRFQFFNLLPYILQVVPIISGYYTLRPKNQNLWGQLSSFALLVGDNLSSLLRFPATLLISGKALVKSLTCDNLELHLTNPFLLVPTTKGIPSLPSPQWESNNSVPLLTPEALIPVPSCAPWLLNGLTLMGLNAYFPQLSPVSSLWFSLRAAVPVIHWTASWWFISLG
ncbi:hypothetical protein DSO57_1026526 [Entomophthora muscae]|uniref:Uncharacterized protein n=1 Tax=Entomophthora muscae TaxID=34485 RepID=A0ACC2T1X0_9FUNG|nr:hypothetical protein DSO57_1026526 [Entomophthora muscae]